MNPRYAKWLIFAVLALSSLTVNGRRRDFVADSLAVEEYLVKVKNHVKEPIVLKMADTLFELCKVMGNERRQALALQYKLDYYYVTRNRDSVFIWTERVKDFSLKHNQPVYFYFSWQRKITYLIRMRRFNSALIETENMQQYAIEHNYYPGQIDACRMLGRIYSMKGMEKEAADVFKKAISLAENAPEGVEVVNMYALYMNYAQVLIELKQFDDVQLYLEKAKERCNDPAQYGALYYVSCLYYLAIFDYDKAEECINNAETARYSYINVGSRKNILDSKIDLLIGRKRYDEALVMLDSLADDESYNTYFKRSKALLGAEKYKEATAVSKQWLSSINNIRINDIKENMSEALVMMDVDMEKSELQMMEIQMKDKWLTSLWILLSALVACLVILVFVFKRAYKINVRLKTNEKELSEAVVKLEEVVQVKQLFLQQLSHEIRTPLNAIVGFSYIIAESAQAGQNNKEAGENYCKAITNKSQELINIVNQAL